MIQVNNYAIFCPFYITNNNQGKWILNWIYNVAIHETAQKFYTLSFDDTVNIELYKNEINKLNEFATCICIKKTLTHPDSLKIAHDYIKNNNFTYMIHIEQDVITNKAICDNIINKLSSDNNNFAITNIKSANYFDTPSDIDISIFAINVQIYDSNFYTIYIDTKEKSNDPTIYDIIKKWNKKPTILESLSNDIINKHIYDLLNIIYENESPIYWLKTELSGVWHSIKLLNPTFIDTARTYIIYSFINNKLTIINDISLSAKHLKQSRNNSNTLNITINKIIEYFGYSPYANGNNSIKKRIENPYYSNGIDIVVISKNQYDHIKKMLTVLKFELPLANRIFVLDRCTDDTKKLLCTYNEHYIERNKAIGFCAGSARNIGLAETNKLHDVLFLDGDRIPTNLTYERMIQMLYYFDVSLIKTEHDIRSWFYNVPTFNNHFGKFNNDVWSSAILIRRDSINKIFKSTNSLNLFNELFDGHWGCEDEYLGDLCYKLNMTCGGFPSSVFVAGSCTTIINNTQEYKNQVKIRKTLRNSISKTIHKSKILIKSGKNREENKTNIKNFIKNHKRVDKQ